MSISTLRRDLDALAAEGEAIRVQVKDQQRDAAGKTDNQPVVGVTVTVGPAANPVPRA